MLTQISDFLKPKHEVYTIGYQGLDINKFISLLKKHKIKNLIDVRENGFSRKPFFSRQILKRVLEDKGIGFIAVPEVGAPKEFRDKYYKKKQFEKFFRLYEQHIEKGGRFGKLQAHINGERVCIMCFEEEPDMCHRHILANKLEEEMSAEIVHIKQDLN
ncbi:DUF488 domain-containing protein [Candidatus Woesearchaeota archaeon]|nr:DUF488 domain-containing protein [Candidatus Woesearchaeota archaeon]